MRTVAHHPGKSFAHAVTRAGALYRLSWRHRLWRNGSWTTFAVERIAKPDDARAFAARWGIEVPDAR